MITFDKCKNFKGTMTLPSDKSITHRAIMMAAMADDVSVIEKPLMSRDTMATIDAMRALGADILVENEKLLIKSDGYRNFREPSDIIDCSNSGTTARLLSGLIAPAGVFAVLTGDASLKRRPMDRVIKPLAAMGAELTARSGGKYMPLAVKPTKMYTADIIAEVKSAQVKSAVLLAAAQLDGVSTYAEKTPTRDHTERMLKSLGAELTAKDGIVTIKGGAPLKGVRMEIPADFSSAAFFIAAGLAFEGSDIVIEKCGLNPTRTGFLNALETLGVKIERHVTNDGIEPTGDIFIRNATTVKGGVINGSIVANLIDEVPVLAFLGLFAENAVEIRDAAELRVKESDRIAALVANFRALGADIEEYPDGIKVYPLKNEPSKAVLKSFDDHRICMVNILLAKKFGVKVLLDDVDAIDVSFPDFIGRVLELEQR